MVEFIFSVVGCISAVIGCATGVIAGCVAIRRWRKRRHIDRVTRDAFAQVGASAEWVRSEFRRMSRGDSGGGEGTDRLF